MWVADSLSLFPCSICKFSRDYPGDNMDIQHDQGRQLLIGYPKYQCKLTRRAAGLNPAEAVISSLAPQLRLKSIRVAVLHHMPPVRTLNGLRQETLSAICRSRMWHPYQTWLDNVPFNILDYKVKTVFRG